MKNVAKRVACVAAAVALCAGCMMALSACQKKEPPSYQAVVVSDTLEERGIYCVQITDGQPSSGLFILTPPENPSIDPSSLKAGDLLDVYGSQGMTMSLPGLANCTDYEVVGTVEGEAYGPFQEAFDAFPGQPAV